MMKSHHYTHLKRRLTAWLTMISISTGACLLTISPARSDLFGGDVVVLSQILIQVIQQLNALNNIIGSTRQTVSILQDINSGVKEVLRIADTAHVPLPPQVYEQAKRLESATQTAKQVYGTISSRTPLPERTHYQSGVEGLFLSQDAFEYSTFLDRVGERVKASAVVASQPSATRLTAQTLGVVLEAISHSNRIQAKSLEISSSHRLNEAQHESARFESFVETQNAVENRLRSCGSSDLNSIGSPLSFGRGLQ